MAFQLSLNVCTDLVVYVPAEQVLRPKGKDKFSNLHGYTFDRILRFLPEEEYEKISKLSKGCSLGVRTFFMRQMGNCLDSFDFCERLPNLIKRVTGKGVTARDFELISGACSIVALGNICPFLGTPEQNACMAEKLANVKQLGFEGSCAQLPCFAARCTQLTSLVLTRVTLTEDNIPECSTIRHVNLIDCASVTDQRVSVLRARCPNVESVTPIGANALSSNVIILSEEGVALGALPKAEEGKQA